LGERSLPKPELRKVIKLGDSLAVTLPDEFVKAHGLEKGHVVLVTYDGYILVRPLTKKERMKLGGEKKRPTP